MTLSTTIEPEDENKTTRTRIRELKEYMQQRDKEQAELIAQVKRIAERWDAQQKHQETLMTAAKRAVRQFFSAIGWL